jgi:hypothetical protein
VRVGISYILNGNGASVGLTASSLQQYSIEKTSFPYGFTAQPADAILVVVPNDAELVVEAQVLNRDIGL